MQPQSLLEKNPFYRKTLYQGCLGDLKQTKDRTYCCFYCSHDFKGQYYVKPIKYDKNTIIDHTKKYYKYKKEIPKFCQAIKIITKQSVIV